MLASAMVQQRGGGAYVVDRRNGAVWAVFSGAGYRALPRSQWRFIDSLAYAWQFPYLFFQDFFVLDKFWILCYGVPQVRGILTSGVNLEGVHEFESFTECQVCLSQVGCIVGSLGSAHSESRGLPSGCIALCIETVAKGSLPGAGLKAL